MKENQNINPMYLVKMIREKNGTIVDVRTPQEFSTGHIEGALNIPLKSIYEDPQQVSALKAPVVLCCKSGMRSRDAYFFLQEKGINCYNGGPWTEVNFHLSLSL
jgi:phage shock protein E